MTDSASLDSIRARLDRPVVLSGLMGAGKTKLGKMLAESLNLPFADSDDEIEQAAGMSVSEIFSRFGEPYFRDGERRVIARLLENGSGIIATGGGALMNADTERLVRLKSLSVWIRAPLAVLVERTARSTKRPLLKQGNPETILKELMEKRYPVYERADIVVDSDGRPAEQVLEALLEKMDEWLKTKE